jgi:hypothetical protein
MTAFEVRCESIRSVTIWRMWAVFSLNLPFHLIRRSLLKLISALNGPSPPKIRLSSSRKEELSEIGFSQEKITMSFETQIGGFSRIDQDSLEKKILLR